MPAWACSAPQQHCPRGTVTSQPASTSRRTASWLMRGNITSITQEVKKAARAFATPAGWKTSASARDLHPRAGRQRRRDPLERALAAGQERRDHLPAAHGELRQQGARGPRAHERLEHRVLHQAQQVGGAVHGRAVGHQPRERPLAEPARERALPHAALELPARHLEQAAVRHARRAGGLAGAAAQALVEVLEQRVAGRDAGLGEAAHQVEPPARRVGLDPERAVGRAGAQAQPAVDARAQVHARRGVLGVEPAEAGAGCVRGRVAHERSIASTRRGGPVGSAPRSKPRASAQDGELPLGVEAATDVADRGEVDAAREVLAVIVRPVPDQPVLAGREVAVGERRAPGAPRRRRSSPRPGRASPGRTPRSPRPRRADCCAGRRSPGAGSSGSSGTASWIRNRRRSAREGPWANGPNTFIMTSQK